MADIKLDKQNEKIAALNEKPAVDSGRLEESLESLAEKAEKRKFETAEKPAAGENAPAEAIKPPAVSPAVSLMAPIAGRQKEIENVLSQGIEDIYLSLTPEKRREFKKAGEETAKKISRLLAKAKINIREIIKLIIKWLSLIPGVNKYFLEQEAKIKADEIMKMKK